MIFATDRQDTARRLLASAITALLVVLSVAVPMLDAHRAGRGPVVESEHNPSTCVVGHDHTVCAQFGNNRALRAEEPGHGASFTTPQRYASGEASIPPLRRLTARHARAPPLGRHTLRL